MTVKAKKHLGQHFLNDESIAEKIADSLSLKGYNHVLEIGPGMGVLTKYLLKKILQLMLLRLTANRLNIFRQTTSTLLIELLKRIF